jgi:hypothetical protein
VPEQQPIPEEAIDAAMERYQRNGSFAQRAPMTLALGVAARFIRAQVIRELRDAASDEGPRSAYWLAADYLERK